MMGDQRMRSKRADEERGLQRNEERSKERKGQGQGERVPQKAPEAGRKDAAEGRVVLRKV